MCSNLIPVRLRQPESSKRYAKGHKAIQFNNIDVFTGAGARQVTEYCRSAARLFPLISPLF